MRWKFDRLPVEHLAGVLLVDAIELDAAGLAVLFLFRLRDLGADEVLRQVIRVIDFDVHGQKSSFVSHLGGKPSLAAPAAAAAAAPAALADRESAAADVQRPALDQRRDHLAAGAHVDAGDGGAGHVHAAGALLLREILVIHQAQGLELVHLQFHRPRRQAAFCGSKRVQRGASADAAAFARPGHGGPLAVAMAAAIVAVVAVAIVMAVLVAVVVAGGGGGGLQACPPAARGQPRRRCPARPRGR